MGHLFPLLLVGLAVGAAYALAQALLRLAVLAVLTAAVATGVMWLLNTEALDLRWQAEPETVVPGQLVAIRHDLPCDPNLVLVYRQTPLRRWQRTHIGDTHDVRNFWELGRDDIPVDPACAAPVDGRVTYRVPDTAEPGPTAVCNRAHVCARVVVQDPDPAPSEAAPPAG